CGPPLAFRQTNLPDLNRTDPPKTHTTSCTFSQATNMMTCTIKQNFTKLQEKMPFHHVTAGLLYKGNYLSRSLSDSDSDVLASISVEELDGDGQVDFEEFMTILGPKLLSSETRDGFLGSTIDSIFWQFDMQKITLEELKHILFCAFRDHLTMKDIENIIINEEESLKENSGNCQTEFEGALAYWCVSIQGPLISLCFTSHWSRYGVELKNNCIKTVSTDPEKFTRHRFISEQIAHMLEEQLSRERL
ncbi:Calcium-binding protein 8, partial [Dissostichus eleginoides]